MAIGFGGRGRQPIRPFVMLAALVIAAFLGGALGLVWQGDLIFGNDEEEEVVAIEAPSTAD